MDQVVSFLDAGLAEMRHAIEPTGGVVVMAEEYCHDVFRESLRRMLAPDAGGNLPLAGSGLLEVQSRWKLASSLPR